MMQSAVETILLGSRSCISTQEHAYLVLEVGHEKSQPQTDEV